MKDNKENVRQQTTLFYAVSDTVTAFFTGSGEERPSNNRLVLDEEEFEPTVFQLCADNAKVTHIYCFKRETLRQKCKASYVHV